MSKKCIVIGSQGYIGKHLIKELNHVEVTISKYDIHLDKNCCDVKQLDITKMYQLELIDFNVDYIFMFGGLTGTYNGFDNYYKYHNVNVIGLNNLLEAIRKTKYKPCIIFPSTRLVYRGQDKPLLEEDEKECKTIYAINKLTCENLLYTYNKSFGIPFKVFRICVPYGNTIDDNYSYGTIGFFIKQAKEKNKICLYGDGSIKRTFTHIQDVCKQIISGTFSKNGINEVFNIGGQTLSLISAAKIISNKFNIKVSNMPWPEKDLRLESGHTYFDDSKIIGIIGKNTYKKLEDFPNEL